MRMSIRCVYIRTLFLFALLCLAPLARADAEVADAIRGYLEGLDAGALPMISGQQLEHPAMLSRVYRDRNHEPFWLAGAPLQAEVPEMLAAIDESVKHGFAAERYHHSALQQLLGMGEIEARLAIELLLTDAFLSQALHRSRGVVSPSSLDENWKVPRAEIDPGELLLSTVRQGGSVTSTLDALWPQAIDYALLLERRAEIFAMDEEIAVQVPPGTLLRPGDSSERVVMLKQRLLGPGDYTPYYDANLLPEVTAFQLAAGLEPDGIVGANTLEVLNASRVSWIDRIDANLERWRWLPREMPLAYLRVNIAAYTLRAFEDGEPALSMNVIVGKPYRRTPVFTETLKYMVLNPYWNVPFSIATKDKLPLLQADALAEAQKGYETRPPGRDAFVPVSAVDWAPVTRRSFNYLLRQKPGPENALGRIKFMMPNPHAVYLHDTPTRDLFARQERSFSSGCIRLEHPAVLAEWLLDREDHPRTGNVEALMARQETLTINLKQPVPTYLVYFTAFATDARDIAFRRDIYGRDSALIAALRAHAYERTQ